MVDNARPWKPRPRRGRRARPTRPARLLRLASDERLVDHVRGGSEAAFEALYDRHHRGILAFCRHMLGSAEEAEDAVQHTFMAAYRDLVGVRQADPAARLALHDRPQPLPLRPARPPRAAARRRSTSSPTEDLSAEVQRRQDLRDLLRDVAALPDDQRAALVLAELGDVSHDEIAAVLDVPREKVKALVFQARSSLVASRDARDTPCEEIREQLANLRGGSLRRTTLRRHLRECPGCREFRARSTDQRRCSPSCCRSRRRSGSRRACWRASLGGGGGGRRGNGRGAAGLGGRRSDGGSLLAGGGGGRDGKVLASRAIAGGGAAGVKAAMPHEQAGSRRGARRAGRWRSVPGTATGEPEGAERALGGTAPAALGSHERNGRMPGAAPQRRSEQRSGGRRRERAAAVRPAAGARAPGPSRKARPESRQARERARARAVATRAVPAQRVAGGAQARRARGRSCANPPARSPSSPRPRSARHPRSARRPRSRRSRRSGAEPARRAGRTRDRDGHAGSDRPPGRRHRTAAATATRRQADVERLAARAGAGPIVLCGARSPPDARRGRCRRPTSWR